jgi:hypothetical protein
MKTMQHLAPWVLMLSLFSMGCEDILNPKSDDTTPLTIELTCNTYNGIAFFELQLAAEVNDNKEVRSVDFVVNDSIVHHAASEPWSTTWAPDPAVIDTSYVVMAIATDDAGNVALSEALPIQFSRRSLDITRSGGTDDQRDWNFDNDVKYGVYHLDNRCSDPISWSITQDNETMLRFWPLEGTVQPGEQQLIWVDPKRENYTQEGWHSSNILITSDPGVDYSHKVSMRVSEFLPGSTILTGTPGDETGAELFNLDQSTILLVGSTMRTSPLCGYHDYEAPWPVSFPRGIYFITVDFHTDTLIQKRIIQFPQLSGLGSNYLKGVWLTADQDVIIAGYAGISSVRSDYLFKTTLDGELVWWQDIDGQILSTDRQENGLIAIVLSQDQTGRKILYYDDDGSASHETPIPTNLGFRVKFYRDDQILITGNGLLRCQSVADGAVQWDFDDDGNYWFMGNFLIATDDLHHIYLATSFWYDWERLSIWKLDGNVKLWHAEHSVLDYGPLSILPGSDGSVIVGGLYGCIDGCPHNHHGCLIKTNADGSSGAHVHVGDIGVGGINSLRWFGTSIIMTGWSKRFLPSINNGCLDIVYARYEPAF